MAVRLKRPPSQLLMPLVFAAHAGSLLALTGSPVNVLVSEAVAGRRACGLRLLRVRARRHAAAHRQHGDHRAVRREAAAAPQRRVDARRLQPPRPDPGRAVRADRAACSACASRAVAAGRRHAAPTSPISRRIRASSSSAVQDGKTGAPLKRDDARRGRLPPPARAMPRRPARFAADATSPSARRSGGRGRRHAVQPQLRPCRGGDPAALGAVGHHGVSGHDHRKRRPDRPRRSRARASTLDAAETALRSATRCCCRAHGGRSTNSLADPDVLVVNSPELVRRQAVPMGQGATQAVVILLAMVVDARHRHRADGRRRHAGGRRRSCSAAS